MLGLRIMGQVITFPKRQDAPLQSATRRGRLTALESIVLCALRSIRNRRGPKAFDKAASRLMFTVAAVIAYEQGRERLLRALDEINEVSRDQAAGS